MRQLLTFFAYICPKGISHVYIFASSCLVESPRKSAQILHRIETQKIDMKKMGLLNVPLTSFLVLIVRNNVFIGKSDKIIYLAVFFIVLNGLTHPVDILVNFDL